MNIVPTENKPGRKYVTPRNNLHIFDKYDTNIPGLKCRYSKGNLDDIDFIYDWDPGTPNILGTYGCGYLEKGKSTEFSRDDQEIVLKYLKEQLEQKNKIVIVEIGVCRNRYDCTSTCIFLDNKRDCDIYLGIDIENKSFLNNPSKNIYTIKSKSQDFNTIYQYFSKIGITNIDILMIDGHHSINQVYLEWQYTSKLNSNGVVIFHDTNCHPGPTCIINSINTNKYDVFQYFNDIWDWGISVAITKTN